MLYLNKQRLLALEELQKAERDREYLLARVAQLEAEAQAALEQRELLEQRLKTAESAVDAAQSRGRRDNHRGGKPGKQTEDEDGKEQKHAEMIGNATRIA